MSSKLQPLGNHFINGYLHPLFGASNDSEMFTQMVWISFFYILSVAASMAMFPAPYGRYSSSKYGFLLPTIFAWITQESPSFIMPLVLLWGTSAICWSSLVNKLLLIGFVTHYINRSIIYPLCVRGSKKTPFIPYISAMLFSIFNGFMQGHYLLNYYQYDNKWLTSPQFVIGYTMLLVGMAINIYSDQLLIHLRKPGETGYKIPVGGLFNYVTAANFLGEIIEWAGFALASCSAPSAIFALFSAVFLIFRAWHHHKYYLSKFEDYPKTRKIIFPFIF
ncbi:Uncharacterized protein APZ42_012479 [Daphnia magna]|uniref:3-oxo-5alpha-steroid 4-dehydrogenase (NADP(+)) n=1 Tax=Daphnia magna TaxID=35525 RepID=A0A0P5SY65_9CRUS|nr:Uncharacterized protein APZ42_012479 [Daphnia magna]